MAVNLGNGTLLVKGEYLWKAEPVVRKSKVKNLID